MAASASATTRTTRAGCVPSGLSDHFGNKACTACVSWSATQITCNVPTNAKYGKVSVTVTTFAGKSKAKNFTVKR